MTKKTTNYGEDDVIVFEGLSAVRHRPGMYIGELGNDACFTLGKEAIDNALDEHLAKRNDTVQVAYTKDKFVVIGDHGAGIPVKDHPRFPGKSTLEILFTQLHAGGKFNSKAYSVSRGCFTGDTEIRLLDGRVVTFEWLYNQHQKTGEHFQCFALNPKTGADTYGQITHVQLTKFVNQIAKVTLSNGKTIRSTVDHPYYVNDSGKTFEIKAKDLKKGFNLTSRRICPHQNGLWSHGNAESTGLVARDVYAQWNGIAQKQLKNVSIHNSKELYDCLPENLRCFVLRGPDEQPKETTDKLRYTPSEVFSDSSVIEKYAQELKNLSVGELMDLTPAQFDQMVNPATNLWSSYAVLCQWLDFDEFKRYVIHGGHPVLRADQSEQLRKDILPWLHYEATFGKVVDRNEDTFQVTNVEIEELEQAVPVYGLTVEPTHAYLIEPGVYVSNTHGVGNKAITALSTELHVFTKRDGVWYSQSYSKGVPTTKVQKADKSELSYFAKMLPDFDDFRKNGATLLAWKVDESVIGKNAQLDEDRVDEYLSTISLLNPGFVSKFKHKDGKVVEYVNEDGPQGFIDFYLEAYGLKAIESPLIIQRAKKFLKTEKRHNAKGVLEDTEVEAQYRIEVGVQIVNEDKASVWAYTNSGYNANGGTHLNAFWACFYACIKQFAKDSNFTERDVTHGLLGYVNWYMSEPQFNSQTKERLISPVGDEVWELCAKDITAFLNANELFTNTIIERAEAMAAARLNVAGISALAAVLKDKNKKGDGLPEKLRHATVKPVELFLVEGDSADGSTQLSRIAEYQEVLPLRGKVTNVVRNGVDAALKSEPIIAMLRAMQFDPKKAAKGKLELRHERVFIAPDADPDGQHIKLLVIGALWTLVPQLIEQGRLFVIESPLYLAIHEGKEYTGGSMSELKAQLPANFKNENVIRAKGLGELTPEWMYYTLFNPDTRRVTKVMPPTTEEEAKWFNALVGEDSSARKMLLGVSTEDEEETSDA